MAYDPDAHQRLEDLSTKYRDWYLSHARDAHEAGRPVLNADHQLSSLSECYEDAMVTAQALVTYLTENPPPDGMHQHQTVRHSPERSHISPS
jgi:hypothetical protein